jgi:hypothetical protein
VTSGVAEANLELPEAGMKGLEVLAALDGLGGLVGVQSGQVLCVVIAVPSWR